MEMSAQPNPIGPFRVEREIASGGMAEVFEVLDPSGRRLALKRLTHKEGKDNFIQEFEVLSDIEHPQIVTVFDHGFDDTGRPWMTMELLDGVSAQVHVRSVGYPGSHNRNCAAVQVVGAVASALACLHRKGIVHQDIKSSNVLVLLDGTVKLLDFGSVRLVSISNEETLFMGTFAYASPEQVTGGEVTDRADIYALGALFYRLLTGLRPFDSDSYQRLVRLHLEHTPPPPHHLRSGVPRLISDLVMQMLSKEATQRPSAQQLAATLADLPSDTLPSQLESLPRRERRVLQVLALSGTAITIVGLQYTTELCEKDVLVNLEKLTQRKWVQREGDGWSLSCLRTGRLVLEQLKKSRRFLLERRLKAYSMNLP